MAGGYDLSICHSSRREFESIRLGFRGCKGSISQPPDGGPVQRRREHLHPLVAGDVAEVVERAIERGLPVLCEKPLTGDLPSTIELVQRIEIAVVGRPGTARAKAICTYSLPPTATAYSLPSTASVEPPASSLAFSSRASRTRAGRARRHQLVALCRCGLGHGRPEVVGRLLARRSHRAHAHPPESQPAVARRPEHPCARDPDGSPARWRSAHRPTK